MGVGVILLAVCRRLVGGQPCKNVKGHVVTDSTGTMQPLPLPPYSQWIVDVACQRPVGPEPPHPEIRTPANFLTALLRILSLSIQAGAPVTRLGMDRAMDAVFALPQMAPVLANAAADQNAFVASHLPACDARFVAFWNHVVRPAWDQHADIYRACAASAVN